MRLIRAACLGLALAMLSGAPPVAAGCDASCGLVDFGRVEFRRPTRVSGKLTVRCDAPTRFEVIASEGFGDYGERRMRGPDGAELRYNLFVDAARQRVWGDGLSAGTARI